MPYRNKRMLRDANGDLIPQYWDVAEQEFKPLTGSGGANDVRVTGSLIERERLASNLLVTSGSQIYIKLNVDLSEFVRFSIYIEKTTYDTPSSSPVVLSVTPTAANSGRVELLFVDDSFNLFNHRNLTKSYQTISPAPSFWIQNTSDEDNIYTIDIYKFRR